VGVPRGEKRNLLQDDNEVTIFAGPASKEQSQSSNPRAPQSRFNRSAGRVH